MQQLTNWTGEDNDPVWSPDSKYIAYLQSTSDSSYLMYDQSILAVIPVSGGKPKLLSASLDRPVDAPAWSADGKSLAVLISDDRISYVGAYDIGGGKLTKIAGGKRSFEDIKAAPGGEWLTVMSEPQLPSELYALKNNGDLRRMTYYQNDFIAPLKLADVDGFSATSTDGNKVNGLFYRPAGVSKHVQLPFILFIHGGPVAQDDYGFDLSRQMLAGDGYAVAAVNYRGSNGRGLKYTTTISGDWGDKEVLDLEAAINQLISNGWIDSTKMGVAGWSYGGILTDYMIATDQRLKAASSGAGTAFAVSMYGVDQYVLQYDNELGVPWKHLDNYVKISYPFLHADKIQTPTLFMGGDKDMNVPLIGGEQMYEALKSQHKPAELVVYPGQYHGIRVPSYLVDRYQRWLDWFDKYLK